MKANKFVMNRRSKSRYKQMTNLNLKIEKKPWDLENPKWRTDFENEILESSNLFRARHHSPPLITNTEIAKIAQDWANYLAKINKTIHRPDNRYGENIFYKWHRKHLISGVEVSQSFYNEIKYYYPYFQKEPNLEHFHRFGHFSQMLWRETEEMGTGIAVSGDKIFVVINYHPRGNWPDEYAMNVLPVAITSAARLNLIKSNPHPDHHNYIPPALRGKIDATPKSDPKELPPIVPVVATPIQPATETGSDSGGPTSEIGMSEFSGQSQNITDEGTKESTISGVKEVSGIRETKAIQAKPAAIDISNKSKPEKKVTKDGIPKVPVAAAPVPDVQVAKIPVSGRSTVATIVPKTVIKKEVSTQAQAKGKVQRAKISHPAQAAPAGGIAPITSTGPPSSSGPTSSIGTSSTPASSTGTPASSTGSGPGPVSGTGPTSSTGSGPGPVSGTGPTSNTGSGPAPGSGPGPASSTGSGPATVTATAPNPMEFNPDGEKTLAAGLGTLQTIRVRSKPGTEQQTKPNSMAAKFDEEKNATMSKT